MNTIKVYTGALNYANMTEVANPFTADGRIVQMKLGNELWETHDYGTLCCYVAILKEKLAS
jgi:hypothetical protein